MRHRSVSLAIVTSIVIAASTSNAASPPGSDDKAAAAEALFREANRLIDSGRYEEACAKLKESDELDHGAGTKFRLGECYERSGRLASAWAIFIEVARELRRAADLREPQATARAEAIEPRLPKLRIVVPPETAKTPGLEVRRNGTLIKRALWDQPLPVDPGEQTIEARAPGRKPVLAKIGVREAESASVNVPDLERASDDGGSLPPQRVGAIVAGGAGIAGLVVGGIFGARTFSLWADADKQCPLRRGCSDKAIALGDEARASATISNVGFIAGGAFVAAAGILWLTAPSAGARTERAAISVIPAVGPGGALGMVRTTF